MSLVCRSHAVSPCHALAGFGTGKQVAVETNTLQFNKDDQSGRKIQDELDMLSHPCRHGMRHTIMSQEMCQNVCYTLHSYKYYCDGDKQAVNILLSVLQTLLEELVSICENFVTYFNGFEIFKCYTLIRNINQLLRKTCNQCSRFDNGGKDQVDDHGKEYCN